MANVLGTLFSEIADAIRTQTGETGTMKPADFPAEILSIVTGTDSSGGTSSGESSGTIAGGVSKPMMYKSGNFYPTKYYHRVSHNMGVVPDMILVLNSKCGYGYGTVINAVGFSKQMLDAFPDLKSHTWFCYDNYDSQPDTAPYILDNQHRYPMETWWEEMDEAAAKYGHISYTNSSSFIVGGEYAKLMTEYTDGEKGYYTWYAISGLLNVISTTEGTCKMTFRDRDDSILYERLVFTGDDCPNPVAQGKLDTPTRESTVSHHYTFSGWSETNGGSASDSVLTAVTESRILYAAYTATVRQYTVRFYDGTTLLSTKQVNYNAYATPPTTDREGLIFTGWDKDPATTQITGDTDFYGTWTIDEGWLAYRGTLTGLTGTERNAVYKIRYTPDGTRMIAATDTKLYLYDATTTPYTLLAEQSPGSSYRVTGCDLSPDGTQVAVTLKRSGTSLYDTVKLYRINDTSLSSTTGISGTLAQNTELYAPRFSHDGTKLAMWSQADKGVVVCTSSNGSAWTLTTTIGTSRNFYTGPTIYNIDLAFSPDDTILSAVFGRNYSYIAHTLFDMTTYTDVGSDKSAVLSRAHYQTTFHPSGDRLVTAGVNQTIGTSKYKCICEFTLSGEGTANERTFTGVWRDPFNGSTYKSIYGMEYGPAGKVLLLAHQNASYILGLDADTWEALETPSTIPDTTCYGLAVSPDGKVAVGTEGGKVFTYQLRE